MNVNVRGAVQSVSKAVPNTSDMKLKVGRLDKILTQTLLPSFALHTTLMSSIYLFCNNPDVFAELFPIFLTCFLVMGVRLLKSGHTIGMLESSRRLNALFGFFALAILSWMVSNNMNMTTFFHGHVFAGVIVIMYLFVCVSCVAEKIQTLSLVVIGVYSQLFFQVFYESSEFWEVAALSIALFSLGFSVILKKGDRQYLIGFVMGFLIVVSFEYDSGFRDQIQMLVGFTSVAIIALFIYQIEVGTTRQSEFVRFVAEGAGVVFLLVTVSAVMDATNLFASQKGWLKPLISAFMLVIYTLALCFKRGNSGVMINLLWITMLLGFSVFAYFDHTPSISIATGILLISLMLSIVFDSQFVRMLTILCSVPLLIWSYMDIEEVAKNLVNQTANHEDGEIGIVTQFDFLTLVEPSLLLIGVLGSTGLVSGLRRPGRGLAWWKGIMNPRNAVVIRNSLTSLQKVLKNLPIVGWIWGAFLATVDFLRFINGKKNPLRVFDVLSIFIYVIAALGTVSFATALLANWLVQPDENEPYRLSVFVATLFAWVTWGAILIVIGRLRSRTLYSLIGVLFLMVPAVIQARFSTILPPNLAGLTGWLIFILMFSAPIYLGSLLPRHVPND